MDVKPTINVVVNSGNVKREPNVQGKMKMKPMIQYNVTAKMTNDFGTKVLHTMIEGTDPDDVCYILNEQIKGVAPPIDLKIVQVSENLMAV